MNLTDTGHLAFWINIFFAVAAVAVAYAAVTVAVAVRQLRATHGRPTRLVAGPVATPEETVRHAA